jgi:hypothetical protein
MRYVGIALLALALVGAYDYFASRPIDWRPGVLVAAEPKQVDLADAAPVEHGSFKLTPRASFAAEVRVLSRERYRTGALAEASPLDIAVGWGPMSDSAVLAYIEVTQANRFYFWHYDEEPPIPRDVIESHSANWHLVPRSTAVWKTLSGIRESNCLSPPNRQAHGEAEMSRLAGLQPTERSGSITNFRRRSA